MSPILVRPVREQLEHDRVIRLLQARYKRKFEVVINPGHEQAMPVDSGSSSWYPDLVLQSSDKHRKLAGVVEVETVESVNHLEAMSEWGALSRVRAPFHLYVPTSCIESARRLISDFGLAVAELWAYQTIGDQPRFMMVQRTGEGGTAASAAPSGRGNVASAAAKRDAGGADKPRASTKAAKSSKASKPAVRKASNARRKPGLTTARKGAGASAHKAAPVRKPARAGVSKNVHVRPAAPGARKPANVAAPRRSGKTAARKGAPAARTQKHK